MTPVRRFFLGFAVVGGVSLAVAHMAGGPISRGVARATAWSAGQVLTLLGNEARAEGHRVILGSRDLEVGVRCTALGYAAIFLCALAAWPAPWRRRAAAVLVAVALLALMDAIRVTTLVLLVGSPAFEAAHVLSGAVYVAILLVLWLGWTRLSGTPARISLAHPAVTAAVALAFLAGAGELLFAQGPPPPPPPPDIVPLGGGPFALLGVAASSWFLLRARR